MAETTWTQSAGMVSDEDTDNLESYSEQAEASKDAAAVSAAAAEAAKVAAAASEAAALASKNNAATSATTATTGAATATTKASEAAASATSASTSATAAQTAQTAAEAAETAAAASETASAASAAAASTSETNAATSASAASTSETNSATSETNAATSETNAANSATASASSATASAASATAASASETAAAASETAAATSETNSATSASSAATSATNAATSETNASTSATAAASSASSASASADAALAALDNFDDRYLGQKASDPTLDNDGNALVAGALYFNTTDDVMKVYEGSVWVAAYASLSGALLATNNLSDVLSAAAARTNLGLGTAATTAATDYATAAQGALADSAVQPNDSPTFAGLTTTGNVSFGDNDKAIFGDGSDLQIYAVGGNSFIQDTGSGSLFVTGASGMYLQNGSNETYLDAFSNGAVRLFYDNAQKLATTSTGIDVTGTVTADGLTVSNGIAYFNSTTPDIRLMESDAADQNTQIRNNAGDLQIRTLNDAQSAATLRFNIDHSTGDISFYEDTGTTPKFFWDASAERLGIGTSSPAEKLQVDGNIRLGPAHTTRVGTDGTNAYFENFANGAVIFRNNGYTERMRIDANGKLLLGTTSPYSVSKATIDYSSNNNFGITLRDTGSATEGAMAYFVKGGAVVGSIVSNASSTSYSTSTTSGITGVDANTVSIRTNSAERMRITSAGNLEMTGGGSVGWANWTITESGGSLYFATGGTNKMKLDASGNLQVVGNVESNATIT